MGIASDKQTFFISSQPYTLQDKTESGTSKQRKRHELEKQTGVFFRQRISFHAIVSCLNLYGALAQDADM